MNLEVQKIHFYTLRKGGFFVFFSLGLFLFLSLQVFAKNASAWTANDCMNSAINVHGANIVSVNQETFQERCDTSTGSSGTYGMIFIDSFYIPEQSSPTPFSMSLKRTTISSKTYVDTANAYVCTDASGITMSSNMEGYTSGSKGVFSAASGYGTITINPSNISWTNVGGLQKYRFTYKSCLNASSCSSSCHDFPMIIYIYKVSNISASSWKSDSTGIAWDSSKNKYKVTAADGKISVTFSHSASRSDGWSYDGITSGQLLTCIAESKNGTCTPDSNSHTSNKITKTIASNSEETICSRLRYPKVVGLAGYSKSLSYAYTTAACVTVYREEPTYYGSFSGSLTYALPPTNVTSLGGTSYLGTYNGGPYEVTVTKSLTRTDTESHISNPSAYGITQNCTWNGSSWGCYDYCPWSNCATISSTTLGTSANNKTVTNTHTVSITPSNGSSQTLCQRLNYVSAISLQGTTQTNTAWAQTTPTCFTVYQPARASFYGYVEIPWNTNNHVVATNKVNMLGNGINEDFTIKTKYTIKRSNNTPTLAASKYTTSTSSQPESAGTLTDNIKYGETKELTANNERSVTQKLGTKGTYCFYMTYESAVDYYANTNRLGDRVSLNKINRCANLYNPMIATFTASIDVGSSNLAGSASSGFRGNGYDTSYTLTAYHQITHNNSVPTTAASRYDFSHGSTVSYPTSAKYSTSALSANEKTTIPQTVSISVPNGQTRTKCFALAFDQRVGYIDGSILTSPFDTREFTGKAEKCVSVYNPNKWDATFSASIAVRNGAKLGDHESISNRKTGDGLRSRYYLTPTYTIKRTNNIPKWAVSSRYAYSDTGYPTTPTSETRALSYNETESTTSSAKEIIVPIDSVVYQCFYIAYDTPVIYIDNTLDKRVYNGKTRECYSIMNSHQEYIAHFTGSTTGVLNPHEKLNRTNNNLEGTIDNTRRITGTGTDSDGTFVDDYPADSNYTASFTHTLSRTDEDKSSDMADTYYVKNAKVNWRLQYCVDAGCTADYYITYRSSEDSDTSLTTSGEAYLSAGQTVTFHTNPRWTLDASNKGKYIYTCHRLQYNSATSYATSTNASNYDSYVDRIWSYNTTYYTTPVCITLKNPRWENDIVDTRYKNHYIDVSGETGNMTITGANRLSGNNYETIKLTSTMFFDHSLRRYDNNEFRANNFDETDSGVVFYQRSIYNDPAYDVTARMWGNERLPGTRDSSKLLYPFYQTDFQINGYPVTLNARNKNDGDSWSSTPSDGRTFTTFNASSRDEYVLPAGITKNVSHSTYNSRAAWRVRYKNIYRQEVYTGAWSSKSGTQFYDRTEKLDLTPQTTTPVARDSVDPTVYTITRPYNYEITNVEPSTPADPIAFEGNTFRMDYNISVEQENTFHEYITDPDHTGNERYVYVITYILDTDTTGEDASSVTGEEITGNPCAYFNSVAKPGTCEIASTMNPESISNTGHPDKPKQGNHAGDPDPTSNVPFRNVYDKTDYSLSYSTGTITVPKIAVGNKFCVAIAIRNYTSASNSGYYVSSSSCRNVSKQPSFQVWGGSVLSAGGIKTSRIKTDNRLYGSWADFVAIANGNLKNLTSGAYTISGALGTSSLCDLSPITISNNRCYDETKEDALGNASVYNRSDFIAKLLEYVPPTADSLSAIPSNEIDSGPHIIISDETINITRDIIINSSEERTSSEDVPQIIIIGKDINIEDTVTRIDALLVAKGEGNTGGTINTCTTSDGDNIPLSNTTCTEQLTVNGAMVGGKILMRRTYGADPAEDTTEEAAEVVNYNPSIILWGYDNSRVTGLPTVVYQKKLPPRF